MRTKRDKKNNQKKKIVRKITAADKSNIADLAAILYKIIRISHRSNKVQTLTSIFRESNIQSYIPKNNHRKDAIENALTKLFRHHKILPLTIFRKIPTASIKYGRYNGNPLQRRYLDELGNILLKLDVDLIKEYAKIDIDRLNPLVIVPPKELIKRLENHPLSEQVSAEPLELFRNGHFNESVRKACEKYEKVVKELSGLSETGKSLMSRSFKLNHPAIQLNDLKTNNEKGVQEGIQYLSMGLFRGIRNIFSHGDEDQRSPEEAFEMLLFVNWLFRQLSVKK